MLTWSSNASIVIQSVADERQEALKAASESAIEQAVVRITFTTASTRAVSARLP